MTETGRAEVTGALLARKGSAMPAGFKSPPARPPQPAAHISDRRVSRSLALWILPTAAIAVAATLAGEFILTRDDVAISVLAPLATKPAKIEMAAVSEVVAAPAPPSEATQLAALKNVPVETPVAAKEPAPLPPPVAPVETTTPPVQAQTPPAARPVYRVQLHALGSRAIARREWRKIKRSHDDLFGHKQMTLLSGTNKSSGIRFVLLQAGRFGGFREARKLCDQAMKRRLACWWCDNDGNTDPDDHRTVHSGPQGRCVPGRPVGGPAGKHDRADNEIVAGDADRTDSAGRTGRTGGGNSDRRG